MSDLTLRWQLHTRAAPATAWAVLADTDRFNRAAGFGLRFTEQPQPDGTVRRIGQTTRFGLTLTWEELPWSYSAPAYFAMERRFEGGPVASYTVRLDLTPTPDGTDVSYVLTLTPRSALTRPLVALDAQVSVRPTLDRALRQAIALLDGAPVRFDPPPPALSNPTRARVHALAAELGPVGPPLAGLLLEAPLRTQDRIRPLAAAAAWGVSPEQAAIGCLTAVRAGLLALRWELVCPSCRAPKAELAALVAEPGTLHCESCNIRFDGNFPDAIEATFRPDPGIRRFEVPVECLASPARTPAVWAQAVVPAGGETAFALTLPIGTWTLHSRGRAGSAVLRVEADGPTEVDVDVDAGGLWPIALRAKAGDLRIRLRSRIAHAVPVVVEDRWVPADALTLGRLLAIPGARALLPQQPLPAAYAADLVRQVIVAVDPRTPEARALPAPGARCDARSDGLRFLAFDDAATALRVAGDAAADQLSAAAVAVGSALDLGPDRPPIGRPVDEALRALRRAGLGRLVAPTAALADGALAAAVRDDPRWTTRPAPKGLTVLDRADRAAPPRPAGPPGTVAGTYTLKATLGSGSHGDVWAAVDPMGRSYAVKLLQPAHTRDPDLVQRFWTEARLLAAIRHPAVVAVRDYGRTEDDQIFLVMDRLTGEDLSQRLERGPVPRAEVGPIGADLLDGLGALHAAGVIHRDVKPGNLWILPSGRAVVFDLGLALRHGDVDPTEEGRVLGTPRYLSPEQLQRQPLDVRTDVYAAGLVLYELLTGAMPWGGEGLLRRLMVEPAPVRDHAPDLDPAVAAVVDRAVAREPADRWPDAAAFAAAWRAAGQGSSRP
jgi:hypothetical protein